MKDSIILFISLLGISYLVGCFIEVSFNIAEWREGVRAAVALMGLVISAIITAAHAENY